MKIFFIAGLFLSLFFFVASAVAAPAVVIPGSADINRISPGQSAAPPPPSEGPAVTIPSSPVSATLIPKNAEKIHFVLRGLVFEDVTVFNQEELEYLYTTHIGKKVSLEIAWEIADALTAKYRKEGYFLSRAIVPAQEISKGFLKIRVGEGSIGEVTLTGEQLPDFRVVNKAIAAIEAENPIRLQTIERQLLLLNDLPGLSFRAVIAPSKYEDGTKANLILTAAKTKSATTLTFDNSGSRYIGPYKASAAWSGSLLPLQKTELSITEVPPLFSHNGKLFTTNGTQEITISPAVILDITAGYSKATPGYTLTSYDVISDAKSGGIGISYRSMRQRQKNLSIRLAVDFRNTDTDILQSVLSRDRIRAVQCGISYDAADRWSGYNYFNAELRHGLPILGSSNAGDIYNSRPNIHPDFTKLQLNYTRLQALTRDWSSSLVVSGQKASGALYSSEEFGYGGPVVGRAYDTSEISGDDGISGSIELRYLSLPQWHQTAFTPYAFYDFGKTWNLYPSQPSRMSAASAGSGLNIQNISGVSGNFYIAAPLTKPNSVPLYSTSGKAPRYAFQLNFKF